MLISLELTNFKAVESSTMAFTEGLNVLRGENEASKSTRLHAIAYALWGSRALPLSLEETVTWGKPVSKLKVKLTFSVGQEYTITRSKSGAELVGQGVVVSGQAEVTAFVERLTGANMSVGLATLMSSQSALQDSLDSSAMALIEKLSNMSLIDTLVSKIQTSCPSGNTKALEQQVESLLGLVKPEADFSLLVAEIQHASKSIEQVVSDYDSTQLKLSELAPHSEAAAKTLAAQTVVNTQRAMLTKQLANIEANLVVPIKPQCRDPEEIQEEIDEEKSRALLRAKYKEFTKLPEVSHLDGSLAEWESKLNEAKKQIAELSAELRNIELQEASVKAGGIYEESCGLCGKLLTEVPEVIAKNEKVEQTLAILTEAKAVVKDKLEVAKFEAGMSSAVIADGKRRLTLLEAFSGYISVDLGVCPAKASWMGEPPDLDTGPTLDLRAEQKSAREALSMYQSRLAGYEADLKTAATARESLKNLVDHDVTGLDDFIAQEKALKLELNGLRLEVQKRKADKSLLDSKLDSARAVYAEQLKAYEDAVASAARLKELLQQYYKYNGLIKKLREVRPVVARELWNLVLHGVSSVFSQIRGVQSVVTRNDTSFLIDGKPAAAYSGSTQDSLGLAIRVTLQKTFLPNVDFAVFDEPASGCSDTRESDMLASIVRAGFRQTLVVTHSELADTFASNVIRI